MKLLITFGIILSVAAFSSAQQVKPSAQQVEQAAGIQSVKPGVVPPMAETAKSTAAAAAVGVKKEIKKKKTAKQAAVKNVPSAAASPAAVPTVSPASAQGVVVIPPSAEKPAAAKPAAAAPAPAKPAEVKSAAAPVKSVAAKPAAVPAPAKPSEIKPSVALKNVQPAAKPAAAVPAEPVEAVKPAVQAAPVVKPAQPKAEAEKAVVPAANPGGGFAVTRKHLVVKGETLWDLSSKYYKDPFKWGKIYTGNLDRISDPDHIYPREEVFIPEITEVIRPSPKLETVTDMDAPGSEAGVAVTEGEAAAAAACSLNCIPEWRKNAAQSTAAGVGKAASGLLTREPLADLSAGMSEEMPEDLKEWSDSVKIAPGGWDPDGVIRDVIKSDADAMPGSLTTSGEMVKIKAYKKGVLKPGDIVTAYMKGAIALDKNGEELGRELQKTGMLEVISVKGSAVQARVIEAVTSVGEDQLIVK